MLESALVAGVCAAGADAMLAGVIPTPAVAYLCRKYHCDAGVMISASHNAFEFNGIKFFSGDGYKLPDETEDRIERLIGSYDEQKTDRPTGAGIGRILAQHHAARDYVEHLKRHMGVDLSGLRIALDCANGASAQIAPGLFADLGAEVQAIGVEPNGTNINHGCGSLHPEQLCETVRRASCDLGLAFDGDADRMLAVDEQGHVIDGDVLMAIIAQDMQELGELKDDTLVVTVMSNLGLDIMARQRGLRLVKTKVGDRYVLEEMLRGRYSIGGEQSGHIILLDHATTGDGLLSALRLLRALSRPVRRLSEASQIMRVMPQVQMSARVPNDKKSLALADDQVLAAVSQMELQLNGSGRILVRASGTEPIVRVMIEGENQAVISQMADQLASLISSRYG
jgi:phosphoglucosamine mutase